MATLDFDLALHRGRRVLREFKAEDDLLKPLNIQDTSTLGSQGPVRFADADDRSDSRNSLT